MHSNQLKIETYRANKEKEELHGQRSLSVMNWSEQIHEHLGLPLVISDPSSVCSIEEYYRREGSYSLEVPISKKDNNNEERLCTLKYLFDSITKEWNLSYTIATRIEFNSTTGKFLQFINTVEELPQTTEQLDNLVTLADKHRKKERWFNNLSTSYKSIKTKPFVPLQEGDVFEVRHLSRFGSKGNSLSTRHLPIGDGRYNSDSVLPLLSFTNNRADRYEKSMGHIMFLKVHRNKALFLVHKDMWDKHDSALRNTFASSKYNKLPSHLEHLFVVEMNKDSVQDAFSQQFQGNYVVIQMSKVDQVIGGKIMSNCRPLIGVNLHTQVVCGSVVEDSPVVDLQSIIANF